MSFRNLQVHHHATFTNIILNSLPSPSFQCLLSLGREIHFITKSFPCRHHMALHYILFFHESTHFHLKLVRCLVPLCFIFESCLNFHPTDSQDQCVIISFCARTIFYVQILPCARQQLYFLSIFFFTESDKSKILISPHKIISPFPKAF